MSRKIARVLVASALAATLTGGTAVVAHEDNQVVVAGTLGCCKR
jgi:hypothetical protein